MSTPLNSIRRRTTISVAMAAAGALATAGSPDSLQALPVVEVTAGAVRKDLLPDAPTNPQRTEATAAAGTEILDREAIRALEPRDAIDLLDKAVGLNVTYQGRRSPFFVDERGGGSMTFVLNGSVLPSSANRILQKIPLDAIEEIQIVRGSTSLALGPCIPVGASASGSGINTGFVLIRTRQPAKTEFQVSAMFEKSASQPVADGQSVWAGTHLGDANGWSGFVGAMASRSDMPSKDSWYDGRSSNALLFTGGVHYGIFDATATAYADSGRFEMQRGLTLAGTLDASKWSYDPLVTTVLSSDLRLAWTKDQTTLGSLFWTKYEQNETNASFANATVTTRAFTEHSKGWSLRHNARFHNTLVLLGSQYSQSTGYGPNTNTAFNDWETSILGWSATVEQKLFDERLALDAGFRQDQKHIDHTATSAANLKAANDVDLAPSRTITLGTGWTQNLFAVAARWFGGWEGESGDFDLKTKNGKPLHAMDQTRAEVSAEVRPFPWLAPGATWFVVDIDNQKAATTDTFSVDGSTYYFYTETDVHRQGLELRLKGESGPLFAGISGDYDLSWTRLLVNETKTDSTTADAIGVSQPENIYTAKVGAAWKGWRLTLSGKNVDPWVQSTSAMGTANNVHLGDYIRLDASLSKAFAVAGHEIRGEVYARNLGNDHYSTRYTTGYYRDRGLTAGSKLTLGL